MADQHTTIGELLDKYDDEHLVNLFATYLLDGRHEDNRRAARIATRINNSLMNVARRSGTNIPDDMYQSEDDAMPQFAKVKRAARQTWEQMKANLSGLFQR